MPEIRLDDITVQFARKSSDHPITALNGASALFPDGKISVILGPSGCGKSTLLRTVIGLLNYTGTISFDGKDILDTPVSKRNLSFVSQELVLYPHLTIFDNIAFPLRQAKAGRDEIIDRVKDVAKALGIEYLLFRKPRDLSVGQKQRVSIARELVKQSSLYLFDEPFSNVDPDNRIRERDYLFTFLRAHHSTVLYVTHDLYEAFSIADQVYLMDEGKILLQGTAEEIAASDNELIVSLKKAAFGEENA